MADRLGGAAFAADLRVAVTVAGICGRQLAVARRRALQIAQTTGQSHVNELMGRLETDYAVAVVSLFRPVRHSWWDAAEPVDIAEAWEAGHAWAWFNHDIAALLQLVRAEVQHRYGIDVDDPRPIR